LKHYELLGQEVADVRGEYVVNYVTKLFARLLVHERACGVEV